MSPLPVCRPSCLQTFLSATLPPSLPHFLTCSLPPSVPPSVPLSLPPFLPSSLPPSLRLSLSLLSLVAHSFSLFVVCRQHTRRKTRDTRTPTQVYIYTNRRIHASAHAHTGGMCVWVRSHSKKPSNDPSEGPDGHGAVTFNRALSQYLDGGSRAFNIATNGGFTAVAVVKFTGTTGEHERIFDFGKGESNDNILLGRSGTASVLAFGIWNAAEFCVVTSPSAIVQNSWLTIVATYTSSSNTLQLRVGSNVVFERCTLARTDRDVTKMYVGKSNWAHEGYFQGSIAGLYIVDAPLNDAQTLEISNSMYEGVDARQQCQLILVCPGNSSRNMTSALCECNAGFSRDNVTCQRCATGKFKVCAHAYEHTDKMNLCVVCVCAHTRTQTRTHTLVQQDKGTHHALTPQQQHHRTQQDLMIARIALPARTLQTKTATPR